MNENFERNSSTAPQTESTHSGFADEIANIWSRNTGMLKDAVHGKGTFAEDATAAAEAGLGAAALSVGLGLGGASLASTFAPAAAATDIAIAGVTGMEVGTSFAIGGLLGVTAADALFKK